MAEEQIDPNDPSNVSTAYAAMAPYWAKIDTLLGGTEAMRAAGQKYTPQHDKESDDNYEDRLVNTVLLNMMEVTLDAWVSKPFDLPLRINDDVPAPIKDICTNVDLQGNSLDVFSRNWFRDALAKGFSSVLVEFPRVEPNPDGSPRTLADDQRDNYRPYLVHVKPENLIFAHCEIVNGVEQLTHIRIREQVTTMVGFVEVVTNQIRVIERGLVTIYQEKVRANENNRLVWVLVDQYTYDLPYIPLVTFYASQEKPYFCKPPLADLADLNVRHFNSTSDQISVLTVARFPIICASGAIPENGEIVIGPRKFLHNPDPQGKYYYLEHAGNAINAGRQELQDLEETMAQFGATFMRRRPGGASATARALDSAEISSPLSDWAIRFQAAIGQAMQMVADWMNLPSGGSYEVTTDFGLTDEGGIRLQTLNVAREARDLSHDAYLKEIQRYNVLSQDFDKAANDAELAQEIAEDQARLIEQAKAAAEAQQAKPAKPTGTNAGEESQASGQ